MSTPWVTRKVAINTSAHREGLVHTPSYTIQAEPPPWKSKSRASSTSPVDSKDPENTADTALPAMAAPSYHAHPRQEIADLGPQSAAHSRLPIFKQVRTMLSKPGAARWDDYSGELSENGRPSQVKPSTYTPPWVGDMKAQLRRRSPERQAAKSKKSVSPVSATAGEEVLPKSRRDTSRSVSPVSALSRTPSLAPTQKSSQSDSPVPPMPTHVPIVNGNSSKVTRKAVGSSPPPTENASLHNHKSTQDHEPIDQRIDSTYSWTTVAPSTASAPSQTFTPDRRPSTAGQNFSTDRRPSATSAHYNTDRRPSELTVPAKTLDSRFSWSTMATNTPAMPQDENEPPTPIPAIPDQYLQDFQQPRESTSIMSRKRPVHPLEREEPQTPYRPSTRAVSAHSRATTPKERTLKHRTSSTASPASSKVITTPDPTSGAKALPLPPFMSEKQANHLEFLLSQERNLALQRRNVERAIADLEKVEKASPLEVSFSVVRDAKKRLEERRCVLSEVKKEEMEMGIKIARARRKEDFGEGEGTLWVRRVTR